MNRLLLLTLLLIAAVAALGCDPPTLPPTGESYVLAFEEDTAGAPTAWRSEHRAALSVLPTLLAPTGARFRIGLVSEAHLVLRTFDSGARCEDGGGYYDLLGVSVWVDYACAHDDEALRLICVHEVGHWLEHRRHGTVHHLCVHAGDAADCYPGTYGAGVLNPWLPGEFDEEGNPLGPPSPAFTALDLVVLGPRERDGGIDASPRDD